MGVWVAVQDPTSQNAYYVNVNAKVPPGFVPYQQPQKQYNPLLQVHASGGIDGYGYSQHIRHISLDNGQQHQYVRVVDGWCVDGKAYDHTSNRDYRYHMRIPKSRLTWTMPQELSSGEGGDDHYSGLLLSQWIQTCSAIK